MSTNDNFDSKKIMEDIDGLENDPKRKKVSFKIKFLNFIETLIFVVLMGVVIFVVLYSCLVAMVESFDTDYSYSDYSYDDSYSDDEYLYDNYLEDTTLNSNTNTNTNNTIINTNTNVNTNINNNTIANINTNTNKNLNVNMTLEEFLKTDIGNKVLTNPTKTNAISNETSSENNLVSEESKNETEYKSDEELKKEQEEQRKNLIINEEGKNINNDLIISIENKNKDLACNLYVFATFYKDDRILAIEEQDVNTILKDNKRYVKFEETPDEYDRYEIFIKEFEIGNYKDSILNEYVILTPYTEKGNVKAKIDNRSNKKINRAELTIIYYDSNGKILDIENSNEYNIWKSLSGETIGYGVWDDNKNSYIEHSKIEVILDAAIHYE